VDRRTSLVVAVLLIVVAVVLIVRSFNANQPQPNEPPATQPEGPPPSAESSIHLTMGNPSGATDDPDKPDNYLMRKPYFALSYNNAKGTPNWVSWCLQKSDLGNAPRAQFYPDLDLPPTFKRVKPNDYTGSGFDRGHMCPHGDRSSTDEAEKATFVMTNIIPQSHACNLKPWNDLERHCRDLAKKGQTLYIVAGPEGQGGEGTDGRKEVIGHAEKVTVPAKCWKVVLALENGRGDAGDVNRVGAGSRVFAAIMPNDESVGPRWTEYRTSAREVEKLTGYRFFDRVPADIIGPLKEREDHERTPAGRHKGGDD
jgi:endonuclease G